MNLDRMYQQTLFNDQKEEMKMTNEHCIMKLNRIIESKKRLRLELRHKGADSWVISQDIAALQHAVEQLLKISVDNEVQSG